MHSAEARIVTANAGKYLQQVCKHWSHRLEVTFTPEHGRVLFGEGRTCIMDAGAEALTLRVEAPDAAAVARLGAVVDEHLRRFAHREVWPETIWRAA